MSIKVAAYGLQNTIWSGKNYELLQKLKPARLYLATTNLSTIERLQREFPAMERVCLSDLSFCRAKVANGVWADWPDGLDDPARLDVSPDLAMARVYRDNYTGGWDHFWADSRGRWMSPQANNIVADPIPRFVRGEYASKKPLEVWAARYRHVIERGYYSAICMDMTAGRLTWEPWDGYLDDRQWYEEITRFGRAMNLLRVPGIGNAWGCGPRDYGGWWGYKLEGWGRKRSGPLGSLQGWGYLASFELSLKFRGDMEPTKWVTGVSTLTPEQRAQTLLCIQPHPGESDEAKYQLLMEGLAACHLMDIGYASFHDHSRMEVWWPAYEQYREEIDLMLRLEPVEPTEWRRWTDRSYRAHNLPDARTCCTLGDLYGIREMINPQGGQRYRLWLNPNDHYVGNLPPRSARLV